MDKYYDLRKLDLVSQRKYFVIERKEKIILESDKINEKIRRDRMNLVRLMYGK